MTGLAVKPLEEWPADNQRFYEDFCHWLRARGYSDSTVYLYGIAARLALGWLDKDYCFCQLKTGPVDHRKRDHSCHQRAPSS
jgi:hypothetical protein